MYQPGVDFSDADEVAAYDSKQGADFVIMEFAFHHLPDFWKAKRHYLTSTILSKEYDEDLKTYASYLCEK